MTKFVAKILLIRNAFSTLIQRIAVLFHGFLSITHLKSSIITKSGCMNKLMPSLEKTILMRFSSNDDRVLLLLKVKLSYV